MVYYVIRNKRTGKCYRGDGAWGSLDATLTWLFHSREQAQTVIDDPGYASLARVYKRCEVVPVQLLRL